MSCLEVLVPSVIFFYLAFAFYVYFYYTWNAIIFRFTMPNRNQFNDFGLAFITIFQVLDGKIECIIRRLCSSRRPTWYYISFFRSMDFCRAIHFIEFNFSSYHGTVWEHGRKTSEKRQRFPKVVCAHSLD